MDKNKYTQIRIKTEVADNIKLLLITNKSDCKYLYQFVEKAVEEKIERGKSNE